MGLIKDRVLNYIVRINNVHPADMIGVLMGRNHILDRAIINVTGKECKQGILAFRAFTGIDQSIARLIRAASPGPPPL